MTLVDVRLKTRTNFLIVALAVMGILAGGYAGKYVPMYGWMISSLIAIALLVLSLRLQRTELCKDFQLILKDSIRDHIEVKLQ